MAKPAVFERNLVLTSAAGRSGEALAEHVMMFALMLSAQYQSFVKAQNKGDWLTTPPASARALKGQTMGIVGLGHTGRALAARASAFGMRVFGYRRSQREVPAGVDHVYTSETGDNIDMMLSQSDILVLAVPLSNATRRLIGAPELALLPKGAMLINISRGNILDQDALLAGLESGHIGGAGLDVTSPEPLPREHRLWGMPNVFITPHMTAPLADKSERSLEIILENVRLFRSGLSLINQITPKDIYC
jgi:phosphoglycerate dehydrogenase-like enzyme